VRGAYAHKREKTMTIQTDGKFYMGRTVHPQTGETTETPALYDKDDLTTHGVVVGMTGSGKTGLCIDLLEELALSGLPAIMIDPKGDITNILLHFPELSPSDFAPWVNADEARREGKTIDQAARGTASLWRSGLAEWEIQPERIARLSEAAHFCIYTPGSDAGLPVNMLASLRAPTIPWESNRELLQEKISGTVTAILGMIGEKDIDPVRSREHILLSNILQNAWQQGRDLSLPELILQVQNPPFEKVGVFQVSQFFPDQDRLDLAMDLNNILAAPAFQVWLQGEPLDVGKMLYGRDGRPRHMVFYIAHLSEPERMFFVTLLYSAIESWMRTQSGTNSLRALVYFDEIFGYLPPVGNPPSKEPMLRMLKQARAFGVGMLLATQNPVDVDYKALSNAGTWFIGKLGTEQDKDRLLDGLATAIGGDMDRREYDDLISRLGKRVFLLRNVHDKRPSLFQTRWAMNYLAGPLTRAQIPTLNELVGAGPVSVAPTASTREEPAARPTAAAAAAPPSATAAVAAIELEGSETQPRVPTGIGEFFLPQNLTLSEAANRMRRRLDADTSVAGILYRPALLARADVHFNKSKYDLDTVVAKAALVEEPSSRGRVSWEEYEIAPIEERDLDRGPNPGARFASLLSPLDDGRSIRDMEDDFEEWLYRNCEVKVRANETLGVYAGPEIDDATFQDRCQDAAEQERETELDKVAAQYERKVEQLQDRLQREELELERDQADLSGRRVEEIGKAAETLLGLLGGRKRSLSSSLSKRRMTRQAKLDVEESEKQIEAYKKEIEELAREQEDAEASVNEKWERIAADVSEIAVNPYKKDISVTMFGVAWVPYHVVQSGKQTLELPGFGQEDE
jgi:hypothetical protein